MKILRFVTLSIKLLFLPSLVLAHETVQVSFIDEYLASAAYSKSIVVGSFVIDKEKMQMGKDDIGFEVVSFKINKVISNRGDSRIAKDKTISIKVPNAIKRLKDVDEVEVAERDIQQYNNWKNLQKRYLNKKVTKEYYDSESIRLRGELQKTAELSSLANYKVILNNVLETRDWELRFGKKDRHVLFLNSFSYNEESQAYMPFPLYAIPLGVSSIVDNKIFNMGD
jgi:hypothetical protein